MKLKSFIKDKLLITALLLFGITTIEVFLIPYPFGNFIKIYIPVIILSLFLIGLAIEYFTKRNFYKNLTEIINSPDFVEGKILKELLQEIDKSMLENVNKYKYMRGRL